MGVVTWKLRKARKEYICRHCRRIIKKGEIYEYLRWSEYMNGFYDSKTCSTCNKSITEEQYQKEKKEG